VGVTQPVIITIDVLAVEGLKAGEAARLGAAFETALGEMILNRGLPRELSTAGESPSVAIDGFTVSPGQPERTGVELARAIYRRLGQ
jgi:hypothetical protein